MSFNIVATPIGNLDDISRRAIKVLENSEIILCEKKTRALKLLNYYNIRPKLLIPYHDDKFFNISRTVIEKINNGGTVSLISDAGTPCLSDPGYRVVNAARKNNIEVISIPTNKLNIRKDFTDFVFKTEKSKYKAVIQDVKNTHVSGRPILIGTTSIEKSEHISKLLKNAKITHQVLNAKNHEKEALIIAEAGKINAVTVATNMAGRGTDIILGGSDTSNNDIWQNQHDEIIDLGGLYVIGTERHEARRIDNQLRGRSGRQGDPGSTRFYVSLEDELMTRFGGERIKNFMEWAGLEDDIPIENKMITKTIENAQVKIKSRAICFPLEQPPESHRGIPLLSSTRNLGPVLIYVPAVSYIFQEL